MTIIAKVGNNEIYTPVEFKSKGLIKKTMVPHQDFADLNKTIDYCKRHNEIYEGLVREGKLGGRISNCPRRPVDPWPADLSADLIPY